MLSLQQLYNSDFPHFNKNAIILGNEETILETRTYQEVIDLSKIITENINKYVEHEFSCLGLVMNHNIYIPSIILSLQVLQKSFIFLRHKHFQNDTLKINWFLSFDELKTDTLTEIHRFKIEEKFAIIWKQLEYEKIIYDFHNVFCVVQTSGSTGKSKYIRVTHNCIEKNAISLRNIFKINHKDLVFWGTPLNFDPTLIELLITLQSGACLLIVPMHTYINPVALYKALFCIDNITVLQMVPSVFLRWKENYIKMILANNNLKILCLGGEMFPKAILNYKKGNNLRLFNIYGITEVSCWASIHEIKDESTESDISIGQCLENTIIEIRDDNGKVINEGIGKIFIGSSSRICYIDDEVLKSDDKVIFRETGDLGKINEKGIYYVGRKKNIIKRFGQKINLNKIEDIIYNKTGLDNKCIWSQKHHKIMSFILINNFEKSHKERMLDKIRVKIINVLPENSVPDYFKIVNSFPLTCHGKIDEKALERINFSNAEGNSTGEVVFMKLLCKYLGLNSDNLCLQQFSFFEIGGNSITALQVLREFEEIMKCGYPDELLKCFFDRKLGDCFECLKNIEAMKLLENKVLVKPDAKKLKLCEGKLNISWIYNLKACVDGSPIVFEKYNTVLVAVGSFSHIFVILSVNGEEIYKETLPDSIECKPLVSQRHTYIYVGCFNGKMYCMDYVKKQISWEYKTNDRIKSSPCFCRHQSAIVFGSYDQNIYCLSEEGSLIWITKLEGSISSSPIVDDISGNIFITSSSGNCYCLENVKGEIKWKYCSSIPIFGSPCLSNETTQIIGATVRGNLFCLCSKSGKLIWKFETDSFIFSSIVSFKSFVIFGCHDNVYVLENLSHGCKLVSKIQLESEISSTPFVYEHNNTIDIITACNTGTVYVINFDSLTVIKSIKLPNEIFSSPVVHNDKIFVGCRDNNLYCLNKDK